MADGAPTLEVGFEIDTAGAFGKLVDLDGQIDSTVANAVAEFDRVKRATAGMVNLGGATAEIVAFGNASTRAGHESARAKAQAEKAGERLVRQLERQNGAFGKTRAELRQVKAEEAALAAERVGNSDLARRLREQESDLWGKEAFAARQAAIARANAAEDAADAEVRAASRVNAQLIERNRLEAALDRTMRMDRSPATDAGATYSALAARAAEQEAIAKNEASAATQRLAREHALLAAAVQGSQAAQLADAAAADRLRMATDPLYAATSRLNAEIAESTRLYHAGATAPAEYGRQQEVLAGRLRDVERQHQAVNRGMGTIGGTGRLAGHHMQNLAFQFQDLGVQMAMAAGSSAPLRMGLMAVMQQGTQIQGIMSQAGIGIRGVGAAFVDMSKSVMLAVVTNPILLGIAAAITVVAGSIKLLQNAANDGTDMKAYAESLGLTEKEIRNLDNVTVTYGDTAKAVFQVAGRAIWDAIGPAVTGVWDTMKEWIAWIGSGVKTAVNFMIGGFIGAYNTITKNWEMFPAVMGEAFYSGVNVSIAAINALVQKAVEGLNLFITAANDVLEKVGLRLPELSAPQIDAVNNQFAGVGAQVGKSFQDELRKAMGVDYVGEGASAILDQARRNAEGRIYSDAEQKGYLDPEKDRAKKISDEQKAYEAALKAANDYIAAQEQETARIGKSAKEIRLMEDAIQRLNAPLQEQKLRLDQVAAAREAAYSRQAAEDFQANVMQPLRDELALYGLVGPARAAAALDLEKQAFIADNMDDGVAVATQRWQEYYRIKSELIAKDTAAELEAEAIRRMQEGLNDLVDAAYRAGDAMADAFGRTGAAIGDAVSLLAEYRERQAELDVQRKAAGSDRDKIDRADRASAQLQLSTTIGLIGATKNLFNERSKGYKVMEAAEKALVVIQLARTAVDVAGGAARMFATLGPFAFPAVAAMLTVMAGLGFGGGGSAGSFKPEPSNTGTGTVLGDGKAQSESIRRAIDALREVDTTMLSYSREMAASLRSIDSQIGGVAALVARTGEIGATDGIREGFAMDTTGKVLKGLFTGGGLFSKIPIIGGIIDGIGSLIGGLFGSKTKVIGGGLFGGPQSLGSILGGGFDASYYTDIEKKKKFFGFTTGTSYSTQYTGADPLLENQFTMILRSFSDAIAASAGPLGASTDEVRNRLNSFVVNIGKIDLKGLTGEQIQEKLSAVFGAAADRMAAAAIPGLEQFQKVGEGAFETLVRVASTVEAVSSAIGMLGGAASALGIGAKLGLADQFDSIGDLTNAVGAYFERFYSKAEQAAARLAQFGPVFESLGVTMPTSLAAFRALVEAQDLSSEAGRSMYATLLQLAPAFADLQQAMNGARSAADILAERTDLERKLLEVQGDTDAIRALDLAKLDASNRALQMQIWALQDAQEAARAADELRKAWSDVGASIMDEVKRIRGLTDPTGGTGFASLQGQFNAATTAARAGDQDAARTLPGLSQALLKAAADAATSRQELDRIQAATAASLEATFAAIRSLGTPATSVSAATANALLSAMSASQLTTAPATAANDSMASEIAALREEVAGLRADNNAGHAVTAGNTGKVARHLDNVTGPSGGEAINVATAA